jgi:hypothetical protein
MSKTVLKSRGELMQTAAARESFETFLIGLPPQMKIMGGVRVFESTPKSTRAKIIEPVHANALIPLSELLRDTTG